MRWKTIDLFTQFQFYFLRNDTARAKSNEKFPISIPLDISAQRNMKQFGNETIFFYGKTLLRDISLRLHI
jgi:hypothetical protein